MCAGLHCSPGSSPSSVWPAAERFFEFQAASCSVGCFAPKGTQKQAFLGGLVTGVNSVIFANVTALQAADEAGKAMVLLTFAASIFSVLIASLQFWRWHQLAFPRAA